MENVDIIWQTPLGFVTDFDLEFITEVLFKDLNIDKHFDNGNLSCKKDNSIIVYSANSKDISPAFKKYLNSIRNFSLFHLSNESLNHNTYYYKKAHIVLRSYFDPLKKTKKTFFVPIGFKSGFCNKNNKINTLEERIFTWAFIGQIKSHRKEMTEVLHDINHQYEYHTDSWNDPKQLNVWDVIEIYKKTIFIPCPFGSVNPDSFRIMEALEWGCIPVVVKYYGIDYYKYIYGDHPFIIADDWHSASQQMKELLSDREALQRKFEQINDWYLEYKKNLAEDIKTIVLNRKNSKIRSQLVSSQFAYQVAKFDWATYFIFWKNFHFKKNKLNIFYRKIRNRCSLFYKSIIISK
jgi:hypothetical protein